MTKQEFKTRWDSDDNGGGLTYEDIATVAKEWGLYSRPMICPMSEVLSAVLRAADCEEEYTDNAEVE